MAAISRTAAFLRLAKHLQTHVSSYETKRVDAIRREISQQYRRDIQRGFIKPGKTVTKEFAEWLVKACEARAPSEVVLHLLKSRWIPGRELVNDVFEGISIGESSTNTSVSNSMSTEGLRTALAHTQIALAEEREMAAKREQGLRDQLRAYKEAQQERSRKGRVYGSKGGRGLSR
jgi:hypothetical protein